MFCAAWANAAQGPRRMNEIIWGDEMSNDESNRKSPLNPLEAKEEKGEKSPWNSLEVSKLIVGSLTPIAVAGFGIFLTLGAEHRSDERTKAAEARAEHRIVLAEGRSEHRIVLAEARSEDRENRAKARDESFQLNAEMRDAQRAEAVQLMNRKLTVQMAAEAAQRQAEARAQDIRRQQEIRIIERRSRIWDDLGPKLNIIYSYVCRVGDYKDYKAENILQIKRDSDRIFYNYIAFFSEDFLSDYHRFMGEVFDMYGARGMDARVRALSFGRADLEPGRFTEEYGGYTKQAYGAVLRSAAKDMGLEELGQTTTMSLLDSNRTQEGSSQSPSSGSQLECGAD